VIILREERGKEKEKGKRQRKEMKGRQSIQFTFSAMPVCLWGQKLSVSAR